MHARTGTGDCRGTTTSYLNLMILIPVIFDVV